MTDETVLSGDRSTLDCCGNGDCKMSFWINYTGRRDEYPLPDTMTANKGAAEIRSKILRKMRELDGILSRPDNFFKAWEELRHYIKGMAKRASAKKGGLGKK